MRAGKLFARWAADELGPVDILFNNAGSNIRKPFEDVTEDNFDGIVGVHLKGSVLSTWRRRYIRR